jgi:putative Ca2+/H+ antiporter (TMEM165/GDT1 family)
MSEITTAATNVADSTGSTSTIKKSIGETISEMRYKLPFVVVGKIFGVRIKALPMTLIGAIIMAAVVTLISALLWNLPWGIALAVGVAVAVIHHIVVLIHTFGHVLFAATTGYPAQEISFFVFAALTFYPDDEPPLPPTTHLIRAAGGPVISFVVAIGLFILQNAIAGSVPEIVRNLMIFAILELLLKETLFAMMPTGITDGTTILNNLKLLRSRQ